MLASGCKGADIVVEVVACGRGCHFRLTRLAAFGWGLRSVRNFTPSAQVGIQESYIKFSELQEEVEIRMFVS